MPNVTEAREHPHTAEACQNKIISSRSHSQILRVKPDQKGCEVAVVEVADAVVDPGAVVVHPPDAVLADAAVVSSGRPVHLTPTGIIIA